MGFAAIASAVAAAWGMLLGTAWAARAAGLSRALSLAAVACCYAALAALALRWLGLSGRGLLGAGGMLVPLLVAAALATRPGRGRR